MIGIKSKRNTIVGADSIAVRRAGKPRAAGLEQAAKIALVALAYFATGKLWLLYGDARMALVLPPAGVGLAAPLVFGFRVWPGILFGALLHGLTMAGDPFLHVAMAVANTLEALAGAWVVQRFAGGARFYERPRNIARFAVLAGILSPLLSPPIGISGISWHKLLFWADDASALLVWWLGEAMSVLVLTPMLVIWSEQPRVSCNRRQGLEFGGLLVLLLFVSAASFTNLPPAWAQNYLLPYLCLPFTIWAALRFGGRATSISTCILSLVALWGALYGQGIFARSISEKTLLACQSFAAVTSLLGLVVSAVVIRHRRTEEDLNRANAEMDRRIEQRTEQLRQEIETRKLTELHLARDIVARKQAEAELQRAHNNLDHQVRIRTAELQQTNRTLEAEVIQRRRVEKALSAVLHRLIDAQETERQRISRELHDELGQTLTALKLGLKTACRQDRRCETARTQLAEMDLLADRLMQDVHRLAWELRPPTLDDLGLVLALQRLTEEWSKHSGTALDFHYGKTLEAKRLPSRVEITLYRITQEALANVAKHANARIVSVVLDLGLRGVSLIVEDDGRGFDAAALREAPSPAGGMGLLGMQERVMAVGGTVDVESSSRGGTSVIVRIPLPEPVGAAESP